MARTKKPKVEAQRPEPEQAPEQSAPEQQPEPEQAPEQSAPEQQQSETAEITMGGESSAFTPTAKLVALEKRLLDPTPSPSASGQKPLNRITPFSSPLDSFYFHNNLMKPISVTEEGELDLAGESQALKSHPIWH